MKIESTSVEASKNCFLLNLTESKNDFRVEIMNSFLVSTDGIWSHLDRPNLIVHRPQTEVPQHLSPLKARFRLVPTVEIVEFTTE